MIDVEPKERQQERSQDRPAGEARQRQREVQDVAVVRTAQLGDLSHGAQHDGPKDDQDLRHEHVAPVAHAFVPLRPPRLVEPRYHRLAQRRQHRVEARYSRGKHAGDDQPGQADRNLFDDEDRENAVGFLGDPSRLLGSEWELLVIGVQGQADEHRQDGHELGDAAEDDRLARLTRTAATEHALRDELVGAVGVQTKHRVGQHGGVDGESRVRVRAEVPEPQLTGRLAECVGRRRRNGEYLAPSARQLDQHKHERRDQPEREHGELNHVGPDDGGDPAQERPRHRDRADDPDRSGQRKPGDFLEHQRGQQHAHALSQHRSEHEEPGRRGTSRAAEPVAYVVIGAVDFALVEGRHEPDADDDPRQNRADRQLQISQVAAGREDDRRGADERHRADLGGDDRSCHRGPGQLSPAEEEVANRGLLSREFGAQGGGEDQVGREHRPVDPGEVGCGRCECHYASVHWVRRRAALITGQDRPGNRDRAVGWFEESASIDNVSRLNAAADSCTTNPLSEAAGVSSQMKAPFARDCQTILVDEIGETDYVLAAGAADSGISRNVAQ